jgi:hypothetical protein
MSSQTNQSLSKTYYYILVDVGRHGINPLGIFKSLASAQERMKEIEKIILQTEIPNGMGIIKTRFYDEENV